MSHYRVAVFSNSSDLESFEELLAPYDEAILTTRYNLSSEEFMNKMKSLKKYNPNHSLTDLIQCAGYDIDAEGNIGYNYNPDAKWDWYSFCEDIIEVLDDDYNDWSFKKNNVKFLEIPYAYVTPDGRWHAPGEVGWFGTGTETEDTWNRHVNEFNEYINKKEDVYVAVVDCHI